MQNSANRRQPVALVVCCILVSGAASLSLEMVWSRYLKLVFGSTTLGITTILVAYMLGLGLGGLLGGRLASRFRNGVRVYGWMEVAIGLYAFVVPWILDVYPAVNRALVGSLDFWPLAIARFVLALAIFVLPTILMGATLPVLVSALVRRDDSVGRRVGLLYGVNTLGAVAGVLGATFVLFPALGLSLTNTLSAGLDVVVGLIAIAFVAPRVGAAMPEPKPVAERRRAWTVPLAAYGIVGFTALAYEVAWTRALTLVLGSSVYAFSTMLAAFLAGIALGSLLVHRWLDRVRRPEVLYGFGLGLLGLASLVVVTMFQWLPAWFQRTFVDLGVSGATQVWLGFGTAFVVMLAPTVVLGALFPLCVRVVGADGRGHARATGHVYAVNTGGSAAGAFLAGFVLIPHLGLQMTLATAIALNLVVAAVVLVTVRPVSTFRRVVGGVAAIGALIVLVAPPTWNRVGLASGAYYRADAAYDYGIPPVPMAEDLDEKMLFYREGINATVSMHRTAGGIDEGGVSMRINGKTDASLDDLSTQVLSGHLPMLFGGPAKTALVIGYASGMTTGAAVQYGLERVDVCEIEPAVIEASHFFDDYNHRPLERDDVRLIVEDGRTYLSYAREPYDVIISEPSNPWISGCSNLFTAEFFAAARAALAPGGRLLQWIQLYDMHPEGLRSIVRALRNSFPHVYGFLYNAEHNDLLLLASDTPLTRASLPRWEGLPVAVQNDLARLRLYSSADLWSLLTLVTDDFDRVAGDATPNTDDNLFVELRAPYWLNTSTDAGKSAAAKMLLDAASGLVPILEADLRSGFDEAVGELACAYLLGRMNPALGDRVSKLLHERNDTTSEAAYGALKDYLQADYTVPADVFVRLETAAQQQSNAFFIRYYRGRIRTEVGWFFKALPDLQHAVSIRPHHLTARQLTAQAMFATKQAEDARQEFDRLLRSSLVETEHQLWMISAHLEMGASRYDEALKRLRRYAELKPWEAGTWRQLAQWLKNRGRTADADEAMRLGDLAEQNKVRFYHRTARYWIARGEKKNAKSALLGCLKLDKDYKPARDELIRLGFDPDEGKPGKSKPKDTGSQ